MKKHTHNALTGSLTEHYLKDAFSGDADACTRYRLYAEKARGEGDRAISRLFERIADEREELAGLWLGYRDGAGSTEENLARAYDAEVFASSAFYPEAARAAADEGFAELADKFRMTSDVEKRHAEAFRAALDSFSGGNAYHGSADTVWRCLNCGYEAKGNAPPDRCPLCNFPRGSFAADTCG